MELESVMQRRTLMKLAAMSLSTAVVRPSFGQALLPDLSVKRVQLVTMCHLDIGFSNTQAAVLRQYFEEYYPTAIKLSSDLKKEGKYRYRWTTAAWLLYRYLEQASTSQRRAVEAALSDGDLAWHGMPFNWQTEMLDRSMIAGCMGFSAALDQRFGKKTIGGKMTDVPGHSRGLIAPLQAAGIRMLDIGVNAASTPPQVPDLFLWKDSQGNSLAMMYHRHDYGGIVRIPASDAAVDVEVRNDNSGPHTKEEIATIYAKLHAAFPAAMVTASDLSEVAAAVEVVRHQLPVVTQEIGDTWIYGVGSDPNKVASYREVARLRESWIAQGRFAVGDATDLRLLQHLSLAVEHTWGTDTKRYLDYDHYRPHDLENVLQDHGYRVMETSWQEKRDDVTMGINSLPQQLSQEVTRRLELLKAPPLNTDGMQPLDPARPIETEHFHLAIDSSTGAITQLKSRKSGREWASAAHPLALFTYQTLSASDFAAYISRYITIKSDWAPKDFGKPGIEPFGATSQEWHPKLESSWTKADAEGLRIVTILHFEDGAAQASGNTAWPQKVRMELHMSNHEPTIDLRVSTIGKAVNRMPEAMWLTFAPIADDQQGWTVEKVGEPINVMDVVRGGGRAMHAVTRKLSYKDTTGSFEIDTLDAPLVAFGVRSPLNFSLDLPDLSKGTHINLFNNGWGTNYPQWAGGDWSYRFLIQA